MKGVTAQDADIVLQGLIQLQRVRGRGTMRDELLMDKLFPVAVFHPNLKVDDRFALASCMIRAAAVDPTPTPMSLSRRSFQAVLSEVSPAVPVPPAPGVERLARRGVADARLVDGWETDGWFNSPDGRVFVEFWRSTHPATLPAVELTAEERITALLFFGLQAAVNCLQDMVQEQDAALEAEGAGQLPRAEAAASATNIIKDVRSRFKDAALACRFLPKPAENFADGFQLMLEEVWALSEHLRLGSDEVVDVQDTELSVGIAATARHEFIQVMRRLRRAAEDWMADPAASTRADKTLLDTAEAAMECFERLNFAAGSVPVPSVPSASLQGFQLALRHAVSKLQAPFRGTLANGPRLEGGALSSVTLDRVEGRVACWKDLEALLNTLPRTKGAGVAFVLEGRVLLPTEGGRPKDKWLGGKVEAGETWWDGALREVDEETFVRSDPWVHRASRTTKPDARLLLVEGETLPWKPMRSAPLGSVQVARSGGVQLERDVEHPCSVSRMSTRDVLRDAFDGLDEDTRRAVVRGMRIALEVQGDKSYRTVFLPLDEWRAHGRMRSIARIPEAFAQHARTIELCSASRFADVFAEEPLDVDWNAMRSWEEEGFAWVPFDEAGPRIRNVLDEFNR